MTNFTFIRESLKIGNDYRKYIEENLEGIGIEIGALHKPFPINEKTKMTYVDYLRTEDLKQKYKSDDNVPIENIVNVDYVSKHMLPMFKDGTVDFICSSHVLEHLPNPGRAIEEWLRVTKTGGIVYVVLPDKRECFDRNRQIIPLDHLISDYDENVTGIEYAHYSDYLMNVHGCLNEETIVSAFNNQGEIHVHVWTYESFVEFIAWLRITLGNFDVQDSQKIGLNIIVVLQKTR